MFSTRLAQAQHHSHLDILFPCVFTPLPLSLLSQPHFSLPPNIRNGWPPWTVNSRHSCSIRHGNSFPDPPIDLSLVANGFIKLNLPLTVYLPSTKPVLLLKDFIKKKALIITKPLVLSLRPRLFVSYWHFPLANSGIFTNWTSPTRFSMVIFMSSFIWINLLAFIIPNILIMCANFGSPYMVSNKPHESGITNSLGNSLNSDFTVPRLIHLSIILPLVIFIFSFTLMTFSSLVHLPLKFTPSLLLSNITSVSKISNPRLDSLGLNFRNTEMVSPLHELSILYLFSKC